MSVLKRVGSVAVVLGLATGGVAAMPHNANAWWRGAELASAFGFRP